MSILALLEQMRHLPVVPYRHLTAKSERTARRMVEEGFVVPRRLGGNFGNAAALTDKGAAALGVPRFRAKAGSRAWRDSIVAALLQENQGGQVVNAEKAAELLSFPSDSFPQGRYLLKGEKGERIFCPGMSTTTDNIIRSLRTFFVNAIADPDINDHLRDGTSRIGMILALPPICEQKGRAVLQSMFDSSDDVTRTARRLMRPRFVILKGLDF